MNTSILVRGGLCVPWLAALASMPLTAAITLVVPPEPGPAYGTSAGVAGSPQVSADGRWVVFTSSAGNLVPGDANATTDVFLRDRQAGSVQLLSRRHGGGGSANGTSLAPDLTPDGRFYVFQSTASDLVPTGEVPATTNSWRSLIYCFDRQTGELRLVNVNQPAAGSVPAQTNVSRALVHPTISSDGQRILFTSGRQKFTALSSMPREPDAIFLWAAATGTTDHVTTGALFTGQQVDAAPLMSDDGRYVVFANTTESLVVGLDSLRLDQHNVIVRDRVAGTNFVPNYVHEPPSLWVSTYSRASGLSADGQYLLYERRLKLVGDGGQLSSASIGDNLWLHHLPSGQFRCVSSNAVSGLLGDGSSRWGALSADGNWVAYFSRASNLVADDANGIDDVFLYNRATAENLRISTHPAWQGVLGGRAEQAPELTPDGRFVLYQAIGSGLFRYDRVTGTNALITADVEADVPDLSADGRFVVFTARPASIDSSDPNPCRQVYCHDFVTGQTELVSVRDPAVPVSTPNGATSLELAAVSATGRFIAFTSYPDDVGEGASRSSRLWVRDTQLGTNVLVSVTPAGQPTSGAEAFHNVQLSADGRWLCFSSTATNLVAGDANSVEDVFLRDLPNGVTRQVSTNWFPHLTPARSYEPVLARNGARIVFRHEGSAIASGGNFFDLYTHAVASGVNSLATLNVQAAFGANQQCDGAVVSADGRWLLFRTRASNITLESCFGVDGGLAMRDLNGPGPAQCVSTNDAWPSLSVNPPGNWSMSADSQWLTFSASDGANNPVYRRLIVGGSRTMVATNGFRPLIANGGNFVAWQSRMPAPGYTDTNGTWDVFHHRVAEGVTKLISLDQSGQQTGDGASRLIALSPDGRYVLFRSHAANLVAGDDNRSLDLFLCDTLSDTAVLLSRSLGGDASADSFSGKAVFTDDGSKIIFESYASDLVAGDFNLERDIFVAQLQLPDSDNDQIPDDWELTYFNTLARDGNDDSDADGHNDLAEFRAGTSPINPASILQAIAVTGVGSGTTTVIWSAVPGRTYQVQARDDFNAPSGWNNVGGPVTATSVSANAPDPAPGDPDRFYRVLLVQ